MVRAMLLAALAAFTPSVPSAPPTVAGPLLRPAPVRSWGWPLAPRPAVVRPFRAPPTPWGAGHRGVDLAAAIGQPVLAAGAGRVTFSGVVAGRGVVVVTHAAGLRTSYEPLGRRVPTGRAVHAGDPLGVVADAGMLGHCAPAACVHWGLRDGARYLDPLTLVGRGPPVLLPLG
ncbi:hypothetical protein GCM10027446_17280 [Angustibacter peucedani]